MLGREIGAPIRGPDSLALERRELLKRFVGAAAGVLLRSNLLAQGDEASLNVLAGVRLEPFVDPLPLPAVLRPATADSDSDHYRITISEFRQKLHRDLPPTILWGFEGCTPGPTIVGKRGRAVTVQWVNRLPERHRLAIDCNLDGAGQDVPQVRTTIHLHGGHVAASSDGYPEDWVTPGNEQGTIYNNRQPGAILWYHDHAMGITRLNAMMGLAGLYLLRDPQEDELRLPSGRYDVPLVLQDRTLDAAGQIAYPVGPPDAPWVPEFFGTHVLVNGRVWPYFDVEPRLYRFRILNASNARVFHLALTPEQPVYQVGSDGGLLPEPVSRNDMLIAPGERLDVVVDFRGREGRRITLTNAARAPYPSGNGPIVRLVMQFRVRHPLTERNEGCELPATLARVPRLQEASAVKTRRLTLLEQMGGHGQPHRMLLNGMRFMDPITEDPLNGTVEIWEFVNTTIDAHPIHLHAVHFQVLDRRPFDTRRQQTTSEVVFTGKAIEPPPEERGWKDTVLCPPAQVTRIITSFAGESGRFVWHCHMLEHEDNEMMRPFMLRAS